MASFMIYCRTKYFRYVLESSSLFFSYLAIINHYVFLCSCAVNIKKRIKKKKIKIEIDRLTRIHLAGGWLPHVVGRFINFIFQKQPRGRRCHKGHVTGHVGTDRQLMLGAALCCHHMTHVTRLLRVEGGGRTLVF